MIVRSLLVVALLAVLAPAASAEVISYSESFDATGTLNGQSFTSLVFSAQGNTNSVVGPYTFNGGTNPNTYFLIAPVYVTATLEDGSTLTDEIYGSRTLDAGFFVSQSGQSNVTDGQPAAGFFDNYVSQSAVVIATVDSSFASYDLKSEKTVTDTTFINSVNFVEKTVGGNLIITSASDSSTFAAVPEPSSFVMVGIALAIGGSVQLRRHRNAKAAQTISAH